MKKRSLTALILAALMLSMSACSQGGNNEGDTTTDSGTTAAPPSEMNTTIIDETTTAPAAETIALTPVSAEDIPAFSGGTKKQSYNCGDGVYAIHVTSVLEKEYRAYLQTLASLGYIEVNAREYNGNAFHTFSHESTALIAAFFSSSSEARLTVLPYDPYEVYSDIYGSSENAGGDVEPLFTMVSTGDTIGMSYVIRTPRGSFIVIDGGWSGYGNGKNILNILKEQNTLDGLPRVAAWILTHPHSDHIGAISEVAAAFYDEIVLERVIFNFIDDELLALSDSKAMLNTNSSALKVLRTALKSKNKWQSTKIIKPHTGDILNIDGVTIDILHTHEDVFPNTDALLYNNAASMAFRASCGEHSAFFTADLTSKYMAVLAKRYGDTLKSDILQPTHHGRTHGRIDVYTLVSPSIVMWDTTLASYEEYRVQEYNQYLINNYSRHYIAENGTVTVSFSTLEEINK